MAKLCVLGIRQYFLLEKFQAQFSMEFALKPAIAHSITSWLSLTMTWVYNQLKYANSHSHIILALEKQNMENFPWSPIYTPGAVGRFIFKAARKLNFDLYPREYKAGIRRYHPGILHSHFADQGWRDLPMVKANNLRHIVTFYGYDVNMLPLRYPQWRKKYHELFSYAEVFLCEGSFMAKSIIELGCPPEKVRVHHLGVDLDQIPCIPRTLKDNEPVKILIAGSFREKKGIPLALEAVGMIKEKYPALQVTIIGDITGQEKEIEEKRKIMQVIHNYGLNLNVRFMGFLSHPALMTEAYHHHIFLSPSVTAADGDTEGGAPVTIIEMAASGMPVVSSRHCDIPEVIPAGLLADERDVHGLAGHIEWLIEHPERWNDIALQGRKHIEVQYNVRMQGEHLEAIYRSLS